MKNELTERAISTSPHGHGVVSVEVGEAAALVLHADAVGARAMAGAAVRAVSCSGAKHGEGNSEDLAHHSWRKKVCDERLVIRYAMLPCQKRPSK